MREPSPVRDLVLDGVEERMGEVVTLTQALVRAPSPSPPGDERAVAEVLRCYLADLDGATLRVIADDAHRPNLVYSAGEGRTLGLFAHTDTVPVGDAPWTVDPFGGELRDDRIYGRGTTDNKGAVAAMAVAFRVLVERGDLPGRLVFCANADEEQGGRLGISCVARELAGELDAAVVAEPSGVEDSFECLWLASRGVCSFKLRVGGAQGHSSLADRYDAPNAVQRLFDLWPRFRGSFDAAFPGAGEVVLNPVRLTGGVDYGVVPGQATVWCECRVAPGHERDAVHGALRQAAAAAGRDAGVEVELDFEPVPYSWIAPSRVDADEPIVRAAVGAWERTLGAPPRTATFPGGTDGWVLSAHGVPSLPGVGPGALQRAHAVDEHVAVAELAVATRLYAAIALDFLTDPGEIA